MQLEEARVREEVDVKQARIKQLQQQVEEGERAARLQGNPDYMWVIETVQGPDDSWKKDKYSYYDMILKDAVSQEQKNSAVDAIRKINDARAIIDLLANFCKVRIEIAETAKKELEKLKEEVK